MFSSLVSLRFFFLCSLSSFLLFLYGGGGAGEGAEGFALVLTIVAPVSLFFLAHLSLYLLHIHATAVLYQL